MGNIIHVNFKKDLTLAEAKEVLEQNYYNLAMNVWSLDELERTASQSECFALDDKVTMAYEAVLKFRLKNGGDDRPPCKVIELFPAQKKLAA